MAHGKNKPKQEEEGGEGAPLWIISFADMMSLLMAFFVMLSTFSGFGPSEAQKLQQTVHAVLGGSHAGGWQQQRARTAVGSQSPAAGQAGKGSEKPTLENTDGGGLMKETPAGDFRTRKVFLLESKTVFWGAGTALSPGGRSFLAALASYAAKVPGRIVISESGPAAGETGVLRAVTILDGLTRQGIPKDRCSIAVRGMAPDPKAETQRVLEIVFLDASVYQ
ncbi:MAG: flagellar motor protein MotB [Planctomycetes bacterium]|jgi:hypothetical protein|nr:flagellar motor protein MotB [Planctomycetota bacterium]